MIHYYLIFFFVVYTLNQLTFILYNYSFFSLLCSSYLLDLVIIPSFSFSSYLGYNYSVVTPLLRLNEGQNELFLLDSYRWLSKFISYVYCSIEMSQTHISSFIVDNKTNVYCVYFDTKVIGSSSVLFYILQNKLFIIPGETSLCFFRLLNNSMYSYTGITIYTITPSDFTAFLHKVQCFCFEEILLKPYEILELPVLFYLDTNITYAFANTIFFDLCLEYILIISR